MMASFWQALTGVASGGITSIADAIMNANGISNHEQGSQALKDSLENAANTDFPGGPTNALFGENGVLSNPAGAWDNFKNGKTNETNAAIAEENLGYQRERNAIEDARYVDETAYNRAFAENERDYQRGFAAEQQDYDRALQQQIFEREDTALERQASSLSRMGINPLSQQLNGLGAGQAISASSAGAAAGAPSLSSRGGQALHNDMQWQDSGNLSALLSLINGIDNISTNGLQRDKLREEVDYQRLANNSLDIENRYKAALLEEELNNKSANTESTKKATKRAEEEHPINLRNLESTTQRNERVNAFQSRNNLNDYIGNRPAYALSIADTAWLAEQTATAMQKADDEGKSKNPLESTKNALSNSFEIVGKALSNTIGKGAKMIFDHFTKNKKQYRSAIPGRMR